MKFGVIHYNTPGETFAEFLDWAAQTGFQYVEVNKTDLWPEGSQDPHADAEKAREMLAQRGLKASAVSARNDFVLLDPDEIAQQMEELKTVCELARIVGTDILRTEGGRAKDEVPEEKSAEAISNCCRQALQFTEPMEIKLAIDNHGTVTNDIPLLLEVIQSVNSPLVGSNLDTMNVRWYGWSVAECDEFYQQLAPHVLHTHIKDGTGSRENYQGAALGDGEIHLDYVIELLKDAGYDGVWCAEYEGPEVAEGVGYRKCLEWMQQHIG